MRSCIVIDASLSMCLFSLNLVYFDKIETSSSALLLNLLGHFLRSRKLLLKAKGDVASACDNYERKVVLRISGEASDSSI